MFEEYTYDYILNSMLDRVPAGIDKREGSVIYDAIAPTALQLRELYINLESVIMETFADTASREYLILRCAERGIIPYAATPAEVKGVFNTAVKNGERFSCGGINYYVSDALEENNTYRLICETAGESGNIVSGELIPLKNISGLTSAYIDGIITAGRNEEDTESLRKRYFLSFENMAFGGNRADYINRVKKMDGVGAVKVKRAWNGAGTVKLIILGADLTVPTEKTVTTVQQAVDPISGEGLGIAPIDHRVTVQAAEGQSIDITADITYHDGFSYSECKSLIETAIDGYFKEVADKWSDSDRLTVRISYIESRLLDIEGIVDIENTRLNGNAANLTVADDKIPVRGTFNG